MSNNIGTALAESLRDHPDEWQYDYGTMRHVKSDVRVDVERLRGLVPSRMVTVSLAAPERMERVSASLSRSEQSMVAKAIDGWMRLQADRARTKVLAALKGAA